MKLYDEGAYEWLSSIAVGGTGADQQMTKPKANSFEELNEERKREGRFMQARILGLVLQGYERTQIGEFIGCSRSTLDKAFRDLNLDKLLRLQVDFSPVFEDVPTENVILFKKAKFSYRQFRRLLKERELAE